MEKTTFLYSVKNIIPHKYWQIVNRRGKEFEQMGETRTSIAFFAGGISPGNGLLYGNFHRIFHITTAWTAMVFFPVFSDIDII